jgi:hypothetical protein
MARTQCHGKRSHLFNRLHPLNFFTHASLDVSNTPMFKKGFYRASLALRFTAGHQAHDQAYQEDYQENEE